MADEIGPMMLDGTHEILQLAITLSFFAAPPAGFALVAGLSIADMLIPRSESPIVTLITRCTQAIIDEVEDLAGRIPGILEDHEKSLDAARLKAVAQWLQHLESSLIGNDGKKVARIPEGPAATWFAQMDLLTGPESSLRVAMAYLSDRLKERENHPALPLYLTCALVFTNACQWVAALDYTLQAQRYDDAPGEEKKKATRPTRINGPHNYDLVRWITDALREVVQTAAPHIAAMNRGVAARHQACVDAAHVRVTAASQDRKPALPRAYVLSPDPRYPYRYDYREVVEAGPHDISVARHIDLGGFGFGQMSGNNARLAAILRNGQLRMSAWDRQTRSSHLELYSLATILDMNELLYKMHDAWRQYARLLGQAEPPALAGIFPPAPQGAQPPAGFGPYPEMPLPPEFNPPPPPPPGPPARDPTSSRLYERGITTFNWE